ncbi:MAG: TonB family protein [Kordiimonadaceae bacterium]|nr:TonB family protein [Kordiimonadaceae bacterium]MBO6568890.1 TonB family protein [Kordiimonadaceae bacterium]MBO6965135.1 TonB family protein [Kordiimonadaceae bacterium]
MKTVFGKLAAMSFAVVTLFSTPIAAQPDAKPADPFWQNSYCINPGIPRSAKLKPTQGFATLLFDVTAEGKTTNIRVTSSGSADPSNDRMAGDFGRTARQALRQWTYFAYIKDGVEAPRQDVPIRFDFVEDTGSESRLPRDESCVTSYLPEPPSHHGDPTLPLVNIARCWQPNIPASADRQLQSAAVLLEFDVDTKGNVMDARTAENQEENEFTRAALKALKKWKYHPFLKVGEPISRPNLSLAFTFGETEYTERKSSCHHAPFGSAVLTFKTVDQSKRCHIRFDVDGRPDPSKGCRR